MDENKEVNSTDPKREKVRVIPLSAIDDAPDHPFGVRDDDEMAELVESISTFGVINPVIVRKGEGERYELISGHRRKYACAKLGIDTLPVIVRDLSREEAIIFMVDSNLQREHILPSERAKAYKMKMEAMRGRVGRPMKNNECPMGTNYYSADEVAKEADESPRQIFRYIRLNNLIPELLEDVDMGKIAFRPAVELSYLDVEEQKDLSYYIDEGEATPSLAQAIQMKKLSQAGVLTEERIEAILSEEKPNQKPKIKVPMERIQKYFSPDASVQEIEDTVCFFGHREIYNLFELEEKLEEHIRMLLESKEYVEFLVGRNGEFDQLVSSTVRRVKRNYRDDNSALVLVLPYLSAEYEKNEEAFQEYYDEVEICQSSSAAHFKAAMQVSNPEMVDRADLVLCCIERKSGGAYQTVLYAKKQNKQIINLAGGMTTFCA